MPVMSVAVWLAFVAIAGFAYTLTRWAGLKSAATTAVVFTAVSIAGPTWIGPLTTDLAQATLLTGAIALLGTIVALRWRPTERVQEAPGGRTPAVLLVAVGLATVAVVWTALGSYFWDEHSCHYATASVIARGVFPPEHPLFPGEPFRYHFGYDILAAHARILTGVPVDVALDVATIFSFGLLLLISNEIGRRLAAGAAPAQAGAAAARWGGGFAMLLIPLGGGTLAFLLFGDMGPLEVHWSALPRRWMNSTPPPVISNFFQHPQGLGMSFALAVIAVLGWPADQHRRHRWYRRRQVGLGAALLGVLALVHIVFFAVLGLALGVSAGVRAATERTRSGRQRLAGLAEELLALTAALGIGYSLGGFFAPGPAMGEVLSWSTSFFSGGFATVLAQHLVLFGLPFLLVPLSIYEAIRRPNGLIVPLVTAAAIGFAVPNFVTYARSWDIVKFLSVGMFFANVLFAGWLGRAVVHSRRGAIAAIVATVLATNTAWIWLARVSVLDGRWGVPKMHFPSSSRFGHGLGHRLGDTVGPRDRVFTSDVELARAAGFLTPGFNWRQYGQGFMLDRPLAERRHAEWRKARRTLDPRAMRALGVQWALFGPHDLAALSPEGRKRLADEAWYQAVADVGKDDHRRLLFRLLPPAYGDVSTR